MSYFVSDVTLRLQRHPLYWMSASNPSFKWELILFAYDAKSKYITWKWKLGVSFFWCWIKREAIFKHKYSWRKRAQFQLKSKTQWTISWAVWIPRFKWRWTIFSWKFFFGTPCKYPLHYKWCQVGYFCASIILRGTNPDYRRACSSIQLFAVVKHLLPNRVRGQWFAAMWRTLLRFLVPFKILRYFSLSVRPFNFPW